MTPNTQNPSIVPLILKAIVGLVITVVIGFANTVATFYIGSARTHAEMVRFMAQNADQGPYKFSIMMWDIASVVAWLVTLALIVLVWYSLFKSKKVNNES